MFQERSEKEIKLNLLESARSRHSTGQELAERYEYVDISIREVLLARKRKNLKGICGILAELINVPIEYHVVVETVLGNKLEHIITETVDDANNAVAFVKQHQLNRVSFIPLDLLKDSEHELQLQKKDFSGYVGRLIDLLSFDLKYQTLIFNLVQDVIIVESLHKRIPAAIKRNHRIVTLNGDLMEYGTIQSISSDQMEQSDYYKYKRKMDLLEKEIGSLEREIMELDN